MCYSIHQNLSIFISNFYNYHFIYSLDNYDQTLAANDHPTGPVLAIVGQLRQTFQQFTSISRIFSLFQIFFGRNVPGTERVGYDVGGDGGVGPCHAFCGDLYRKSVHNLFFYNYQLSSIFHIGHLTQKVSNLSRFVKRKNCTLIV